MSERSEGERGSTDEQIRADIRWLRSGVWHMAERKRPRRIADALERSLAERAVVEAARHWERQNYPNGVNPRTWADHARHIPSPPQSKLLLAEAVRALDASDAQRQQAARPTESPDDLCVCGQKRARHGPVNDSYGVIVEVAMPHGSLTDHAYHCSFKLADEPRASEGTDE